MSARRILENAGLPASDEVLERYGDIARVMGKSLEDLAEEVAQATRGPFEYLSERRNTAAKLARETPFTVDECEYALIRHGGDEVQARAHLLDCTAKAVRP